MILEEKNNKPDCWNMNVTMNTKYLVFYLARVLLQTQGS